MSREPPHLNTDPCPDWERRYYSPCQNPLPGPETTRPEIEGGKPTFMDALHIETRWNVTTTPNNAMGYLGLGLMLAGFLQTLMHHWVRLALMAVLFILAMLASFYAKQPRLAPRFPRLLCGLFFVTFTYPGDTHPPRRSVRLATFFAIYFLAGFLLYWPPFVPRVSKAAPPPATRALPLP